jgi:hypothetical protein
VKFFLSQVWWLNREAWWLNREAWWLNREVWWLNREAWWLNREAWWLNREAWWLNGSVPDCCPAVPGSNLASPQPTADCNSPGGLPPGMALGCGPTSVRGKRGENYDNEPLVRQKHIKIKKKFFLILLHLFLSTSIPFKALGLLIWNSACVNCYRAGILEHSFDKITI